jgi:hypothetical protein
LGRSLSPPPRGRMAISGHAFPRSTQKPQTRLASPSCRTPPGQSAGTRQAPPRALKTAPVSMSSLRFRHLSSDRLPGPHLTPRRAPFPHRSPRRSSANAACGGLKPPPAGRLRRARPSSPTQHRIKKLSLHQAPLPVRGTPPAVDRDLHGSWGLAAGSGLFGRGVDGVVARRSGAAFTLARMLTTRRPRASRLTAQPTQNSLPSGSCMTTK